MVTSRFYFIVLLREKIFVEFSEYVGNAFPHCFGFSRFVPHKRDENFFSCLMFAIELSPLNYSRISCIFSCLLDLLLSLIPCLIDLLADVSHLGLVFSVHVFPSFDEG